MTPLRSLFASLALLATSAGCGPSEPVSPDTPRDQGHLDPLLSEQIAQAVADILSDHCFQEQPDKSHCDWGTFPLETSQQFEMSQNTGEAILIVDEFPSLPPRAIRYRNRLKGFFRVDGAGEIGPVQFSWRAPTTLFNVLTRFASPEFIPAETLRPLSAPIQTVYGFYDDENIGHGSLVFSLLVEANPHQPIVLMDSLSFHRFAPEEFCDPSGSPESIARLSTKAQRVASGLRRIIGEQSIRFVNLSSGNTLETLKQDWNARCGGPRPSDDILRAKLNTYAPIVDVLFNTPGVFTAHAAINASNGRDFPFDFPSPAYPNRLLTGYFTALESGLDATGQGNHASLQGWPSPASVDVYMNSGVLPQRPFPYNRTPWLQVDGFGVDIYPVSSTTTSWMAPLTLSRFIHARYSHFPDCELSNGLIASLRDVLVPSSCPAQPGSLCAYQDPLKHGQIEAVRLGYRPREYVEP
ncbi:uncharacterized protein STAUR_5767 [Stigmatella aurantiaca DW4/3-1]|uniref:Lipoprotein n=1 Tax=Stigmatella aurantiaca (strain DW4/3-1) TaxID=378806 RepID=Q08U95_STIAD|nr:uncharacterized protein STAUR_5767 [Stigmatella aurantiaca DW4/3-1]EAU64050.1 hypothetical protein STIAU_5231 [Stigmatella aurantiaca DW4/3-1]